MIKLIFFLLLILPLSGLTQGSFYQSHAFSEADTLRGMLRPERTCYDVHFYHISLALDIKKQAIKGYTDIHFTSLTDFVRLQIDLYHNMAIDSILLNGEEEVDYSRKYNAVFVDLPKQEKGTKGYLRVYYQGNPRVAPMPPWDGGFVWETDNHGKPWIGVSCEGDGASLWWPNKDHLSDEPDSAAITITVPSNLMAVSNGNLRLKTDHPDGTTTFNWFVSYPINNYNITVNVADYVHFSDTYTAEDGEELACDYYVLSYNLEKAQKHFRQVKPTLACFEKYFGKYPFWNDGYTLVETPYLGMEHQGAIAYGNNYKRGYMGGMIPWNMNWDYIIVHETGHEWWGNSISCNDLAEMWIHESFATYMEALYVECTLNYKQAIKYLLSQKPYIVNREPILGPKDVNWKNWKGSDHYFKGAWVLHTLRNAIGDDKKWFGLLKSFYQKYAYSNITTQTFVDYVNDYTGRNFSAFFSQYLEYPSIPVLEYKLKEKKNGLEVSFRWKADVVNFDMPVQIGMAENPMRIHPETDQWKKVFLEDWKKSDFGVAEHLFLVEKKRVD